MLLNNLKGPDVQGLSCCIEAIFLSFHSEAQIREDSCQKDHENRGDSHGFNDLLLSPGVRAHAC